MRAVYKREVKSYFQSMTGCVFVAFLVAFTGIYFTAYNLTAGYPYFSYTLSGSLIVFLAGYKEQHCGCQRNYAVSVGDCNLHFPDSAGDSEKTLELSEMLEDGNLEKMKTLFKTAGTRHGAYSVGMTAVVVAIVVVLNLIIGQLPEKYRNIDVSSTKIYEITDTSRELLKKLDKEVKMTVLAVKGDADERIRTFISKYSGLSGHISVEWIDPVLHPSALTEYEASENTIVVSCEDTGKSTTVAFTDIIVSDMYSYFYTGNYSESEFDGEGQLTSAVNYVVNDTQRQIYRTTGHGEAALSLTVNDLMDKNNYSMTELNLLMVGKIPDDCELLLMNAPEKDLTEDEKTTIENYLAQGGSVMLLLGDTNSMELPNLSALMKDYGMESTDGYIADPKRCYQGNYYYLFPEMSLSGGMSAGISSEMVLVTNAHGFTLTDPVRDTISTSAFMSSSADAYAVTEENQTAGTYVFGAVATESVNAESRFTVISAGSLIDSQITDTFTSLENTTLFMNAVTENFEGAENLSIEPKSLAVEYNTVQHIGMFSLLVIFGIPLFILVIGFGVWFRRRRA